MLPLKPLTRPMTAIGLTGNELPTPARFIRPVAAPSDGSWMKFAAISASVAYVWSCGGVLLQLCQV